MAGTLAIRARGGPLGRWVAGPFVGLAVLFLLATQVPSYSCGDGGLSSSFAGVVFEAIGLGGAAALVALAIWRAIGLRRGRERTGSRRWRPNRWTLAAVLLALATFAVSVIRDTEVAGVTVLGLFFFCGLLTVCAFLALTVAAIRQQDADEVGMLLPIYLAGAGICVYLPVVAWASAIVGGCWGE